VAAVDGERVTRFPAVPTKLKLLNLWLVDEANITVQGETVFEMLFNVFEPVMVKAPAPACTNVQLNVDAPPTNVFAVADDIRISPMPLPAAVEKFVGAALLNVTVPLPMQFNFPPLKVIAFVPVAVANLPTVKV